ncbi:hypothetical protein D3C75_1046900 [compost metagenome]
MRDSWPRTTGGEHLDIGAWRGSLPAQTDLAVRLPLRDKLRHRWVFDHLERLEGIGLAFDLGLEQMLAVLQILSCQMLVDELQVLVDRGNQGEVSGPVQNLNMFPLRAGVAIDEQVARW